ncbi:MAG: hypothetical protein GY799_19755 [Desulfobulbaceae bacterium]|nr:hypothetical protein [Desulfobulbaceae bacterium]
MTDKFGASHRQLINDTNDGKIAKAPPAPTTSISGGSGGHTVIGRDTKSALYRGLLNLGQEVGRDIKKRKDVRDFNEGYNKGLDEGFAEAERSPLRDMLFGPSATLKGAQKRIVENDARLWFNARMKNLEDDIRALDEDEYQAELNQQLGDVLEKHSDPEIISQLTTAATRNFETLARNHAKQRQIWIDATNEQAVADTMNGAVLSVRAAQQYGDEQALREAESEVEFMFDQPLDMDPDVWLSTTNRVIIENLSRGDDLAFRVAEQRGIIDMMRPEHKVKLTSAFAMFDHKNGRKFHVAQQNLTSKIDKGEATDSDLIAFKSAYPEQGRDLNEIRAYKDDVDAELAEIARQKALTIDELVSGDVKFSARQPEEQRDAVQSVFNSIADDALLSQRQVAFEAGVYEGDMETPFTSKERFDYMLENPMQFAQVWAQHPEVKTPMVQNLTTQVITDLRREELDENGVKQLTTKVNALKAFQNLDGGNFHNQFRSDEDASMFAAYSYLVSDAGFNPINAVREMRTIADRPDIELAEHKEAVNANIDQLADGFLDQSPESQAFWGLYNRTPDNEQAFDAELQSRLETALVMFKGDMSKAVPAAQAAMRRNGIVSNGQFIPNGRKLEIQGGSLENFMRGVNSSDALRSQITNAGAGFAPDVDYTSLELSVNPFNPKTVIMHGRHEETGQPITITLNLPQHSSQFEPYGFDSFTGYNPYIADKDERRRAFLRNNKLMKSYKTVGQAIERIIK